MVDSQRPDQLNPYETAFGLIDSYRGILHTALKRSGIRADDVQYVTDQFKADRGLLFSLQPTYEISADPFHKFAPKAGMSDHIVKTMRERFGVDFHLYRHQEEAISSIMTDCSTVIATGTGSGKTESFLLPIIDHCIKKDEPGVKAILLYPMNALANDQIDRLGRYLKGTNVTYGILTGATPENSPDNDEASPNHIISRSDMRSSPPDILLTNYVMLERILTARKWRPLVDGCKNTLSYVVLDELHTYRGTKATHLMFLLERLRQKTSTNPLPIGASATLAQSGGYISGTITDQDILDEFLQRILGVSECRVVTPYFEASDVTPSGWPDYASLLDENIVHASSPSDKCKLISWMTGQKVPISFWLGTDSFWSAETGLQLAQHPFLVALKEALEETGAKSFKEIVAIYKNACPFDLSEEESGKAVKQWLNALSIIATDFQDDRQALDLRLHIFLRGLSGYLRRCIACGSYHPDGSDMCPDCGSALFLVDKENAYACVAKVSKNTLSSAIYPEENDEKDIFYVKAMPFDENLTPDPEGIRCTLNVDLSLEAISSDSMAVPFAPDPDGELLLLRHSAQTTGDVYKTLVVLSDTIHPREHLRNLVLIILQSLESDQRRLLGFIDDRERASHDAMAISDELAERFFEVVLSSVAPADGPRMNIPNLLEAIKAYVVDLIESNTLSDIEACLFAEMELWFFRYISEPVRFAPSKTNLLSIKSIEDYTDIEQQVLDVFLRERAVNCRYHDPRPDSNFIKFQKHWAVSPRQIYTDPGAAPNTREEASCISLSKDSREYSDLIEKIGSIDEDGTDSENMKEREQTKLYKERGAERIQKAIDHLVENGIIERTSSDDPCRYWLSPQEVLLSSPEGNGDAIDQYAYIRNNYLFFAKPHSSELANEERRKTEDLFRKGEINFLLSTPTLEMGIDIGDLRYVMMVGVPPMPSNYAQRAGRAGRRGQSSMVLCYCAHDKAHDRHYFQDPKSMIDGLITPPSLHAPTIETIKKHARAVLLSDYLDNSRTMREFITSYDQVLRDRIGYTLQMCSHGMNNELEEYLKSEFLQECEEQLSASLSANVAPAQYFYNTAFLPDYGFHHDGVQAWDKNVYNEIKNNKGSISPMDSDYVAEREQELAFTKFAPGRVAFLGGNVYRFCAEGESTEWQSDETGKFPVRSYSRILVDQEVGWARKDALAPIYNRFVFLDDSSSKQSKLGGILQLRSTASATIKFINQGEKAGRDSEPFVDYNGNQFYMGYRINRQSLCFSFDKRVFSNMAGPLSCVSALDRSIKDLYRLDESELKIISKIRLASDPFNEDGYVHFLFYDASGNGDLPFQQINDHIVDVFASASQKLHDCPHCKQNGDNGCYYCLKSFYTQYIAPYASTTEALNIIDYILGKKPFVPAVQLFTQTSGSADIIIEVKSVADGTQAVRVGSEQKIVRNGKTAETVYGLLTDAIRSFNPHSGQNLLIRTNIGYLVNTLSGRNSSKEGRYAFANLKYELLRCKSVRTEKL
ncbi:hypothetical protein BVX94_02370 [bacterium B17]|nr:hypothetical protein BVX94_02370 [bacterium B17]